MAARKTSALPTRIWSYGARVVNESMVHDIIWTAHRYYNKLIEIERARHARYSAIRRAHAPELADLEDRWEALDEASENVVAEQKRLRQSHWRETGGERRRLMDAELASQLTTIRAEMKTVSAEAKSHRLAFSELVTPARDECKRRSTEYAAGGGPRTKSAANDRALAEMLDETEWSAAWKEIARSDDDAHMAMLAARASCALSTGTYLAVEEAVARAKKDAAPRAPRFRKGSRGGKLQVQLRDVTMADVMAGTRALSLREVQADPTRKGTPPWIASLDQSIPRGERRTIELSVNLHREPPPDAVVKWAALVARRVGNRWR